ncbi:MAG: translation elongation factor Ts [Rhodothermales bacterium]
MSISAQDVKRLREITGVGMMDCKKALAEANGDFDAAIDLLRKKGQKVAANRADRDAKEGLIVTAVSSNGKSGAIVEVNCETDFVARSDDFTQFAEGVASVVLEKKPADADALLALPYKGETVGSAALALTGKVGEKVDIRRFQVASSSDGVIVPYVHPGSRLGVLVEMLGNGNTADAGRDVAMQVAALNPVATRPDEVPNDLKEKEIEIAREAARNDGKPEAMLDKIAQGKLQRYYKDNVLIEQPFVKDASITVKEMLRQASVDVRTFYRFALGD